MIYILRETEDYMPSTTLGVYNDIDVAMQARDERIKTYNNEDELHLTGGTFTNGVLNDGYMSGVYKVTVAHADDLGSMMDQTNTLQSRTMHCNTSLLKPKALMSSHHSQFTLTTNGLV